MTRFAHYNNSLASPKGNTAYHLGPVAPPTDDEASLVLNHHLRPEHLKHQKMALTGIRRNHDIKILQFQELASNSILNFEVIPKTFKVYLRQQQSNRSNNKEFTFCDRVVKIPPSPRS